MKSVLDRITDKKQFFNKHAAVQTTKRQYESPYTCHKLIETRWRGSESSHGFAQCPPLPHLPSPQCNNLLDGIPFSFFPLGNLSTVATSWFDYVRSYDAQLIVSRIESNQGAGEPLSSVHVTANQTSLLVHVNTQCSNSRVNL